MASMVTILTMKLMKIVMNMVMMMTKNMNVTCIVMVMRTERNIALTRIANYALTKPKSHVS